MFKFTLRKKLKEAEKKLIMVKATIRGYESVYQKKEEECNNLSAKEYETLVSYCETIQEYLEANEEHILEARINMHIAEKTYQYTRAQLKSANLEYGKLPIKIRACKHDKEVLENEIEILKKQLAKWIQYKNTTLTEWYFYIENIYIMWYDI